VTVSPLDPMMMAGTSGRRRACALGWSTSHVLGIGAVGIGDLLALAHLKYNTL